MRNEQSVTLRQSLDVHAIMIERFGGSDGVRDIGLLESALSSPLVSFAEFDVYHTHRERAAVLMRSICQDHPFVDGNKRTAVGCWYLYLRMNGFVMTGDVSSLYSTVMLVAQD